MDKPGPCRSLCDRFGGQIRIEYLPHDFLRYPGPGSSTDICTRSTGWTSREISRGEAYLLQPNGDYAARLLYGMEGIGAEIYQNLVQLGRIGHDQAVGSGSICRWMAMVIGREERSIMSPSFIMTAG